MTLFLSASTAAPITAQEPEPTAPPAGQPVERIRQALQQPSTRVGENFFVPTTPETSHLGPLTFAEPTIPGQFVTVRVPIGALISRAAHSIAAAQRRRAERAAHQEVMRVAAERQKAQAK